MPVRIYKTDGSYTTVNDAGIIGNGGWGLTGGIWSYRKAIVIAHTADGAQTNYQLKLLVGESSGATGEDVDCGAKVASDFDDLRFTTSDGSTLCDYWIESLSGSTPNQLATVWIEVPSIAAHPDNTTLYMYYGNAGASAVSNGNSTFLFFDDFNDASIDVAKWTHIHDYGSESESGGILTITGSASNSNQWVGTYVKALPVAFRTLMKTGEASYIEIGFKDSAGDRYVEIEYAGAKYWKTRDAVDSQQSARSTVLSDAYHIVDAKVAASNSATFLTSDSESVTNTDHIPTGTLGFWMSVYGAQSAYFDWVLIRNYTANEPTWSSFGAEESYYLNRLSPYVHILAH